MPLPPAEPAGSGARDGRPRFDAPVPAGGYAWWHVEAASEDGAHSLAVTAFIGSVVSPFYAWARRGGAGDPLNHCALNVALYGAPRRWAMTERGRAAVTRDATHLAIGPSVLHWDGASLTIDIEEIASPLPSRLAGSIRVHPAALTGRSFALDDAGRHLWSPIAPSAHVEVEMTSPGLTWSGPGYLDGNRGERPLEADFAQWAWSRAALPDGAAILYDAVRRDGGTPSLALHVAADGTVAAFPPPPRVGLPPTIWRLARDTRADAGHMAAVVQTLEDAPFYSRSLIETHWLGQPARAVHRSLSMDRFSAPWVQAMLPFRVPRW